MLDGNRNGNVGACDSRIWEKSWARNIPLRGKDWCVDGI